MSVILQPGILKEFLRAICYFINDHGTYFQFALVNKFCAALVKEYSPMKKKEFSTLCMRMVHHINIMFRRLPNYSYHGLLTIRRGMEDRDLVFKEGVIVSWTVLRLGHTSFQRPHSNSLELESFYNKWVKCFYINHGVEINVNSKFNTTLFANISTSNRLLAVECPICEVHHMFIYELRGQHRYGNVYTGTIEDYDHTYKYFVQTRTCLEKELKIQHLLGTTIVKRHRRLQLAKGLLKKMKGF